MAFNKNTWTTDYTGKPGIKSFRGPICGAPVVLTNKSARQDYDNRQEEARKSK